MIVDTITDGNVTINIFDDYIEQNVSELIMFLNRKGVIMNDITVEDCIKAAEQGKEVIVNDGKVTIK